MCRCQGFKSVPIVSSDATYCMGKSPNDTFSRKTDSNENVNTAVLYLINEHTLITAYGDRRCCWKWSECFQQNVKSLIYGRLSGDSFMCVSDQNWQSFIKNMTIKPLCVSPQSSNHKPHHAWEDHMKTRAWVLKVQHVLLFLHRNLCL